MSSSPTNCIETRSLPHAVKVAAATVNLDDFVSCYFGEKNGDTAPLLQRHRQPKRSPRKFPWIWMFIPLANAG